METFRLLLFTTLWTAIWASPLPKLSRRVELVAGLIPFAAFGLRVFGACFIGVPADDPVRMAVAPLVDWINGASGAVPFQWVLDITVAIGLVWFASIANIPRRWRLATIWIMPVVALASLAIGRSCFSGTVLLLGVLEQCLSVETVWPRCEEGSRVHAVRSLGFVITTLVALLTGAVLVRSRTAPQPMEHAAASRPSRHAAPPEDVAALNAAAPRRVPAALERVVLPGNQPAVVVFLKADCGCSAEFARMLTALAPHLAPRASCLAVIEAQDGEAEPFLESTGLAVPHVIQSDGSLAAAWGVTKAGCVALVRPDGSVEAIWPGISRQGFRDLATRLGNANLFSPESLAVLPGPATAGCPLLSASLAPSPGIAR